LAALLQLLADLHWQVGNDLQAKEAYASQHVCYKAAGWRDKEAQALLALASLSARLSKPKEAVKLAKEAVEIQHALKDDDGEACALVALAGFQGATTEAARTAEAALQLCRKIGDWMGEAQALQVLVGVYHENGNFDEALKHAELALQLCQKAEDVRGAADMLQMIAGMYVGKVERASSGVIPINSVLPDALDALERLEKACGEAGDLAGRVNALNQASTWHLLNQDPAAAVSASESAIEAADALGAADVVAVTSLTLAEAHLAAENAVLARQAADDALSSFEQFGDDGGVQQAHQVIEAAKELLARPPKLAKPVQEPKHRPLATAAEQEPQHRPLTTRAEHKEREADPAAPAKEQGLGRRSRKAFSQKVIEEEPVMPREQEVRLGAAPGVPDQELRRRQLRAAQQAPVMTNYQEPVRTVDAKESRQEKLRKELANNSKKIEVKPSQDEIEAKELLDFLAAARPAWSETDLASVQEKLAAIQITSVEGLCMQLTKKGGLAGLNDKLKDSGWKAMKMETLKQLKEQARSTK